MNEQDLKRLIPDEGLRNYIVESTWGDDPFGDSKNYYTMMDAIVNLAFVYSFSCFTDIRNRNVSFDGKDGILDKCIRNGNANSLRVFRTLDKIYSEYPVSNELIQFVLFDIQFDFLLGEESKLARCFPGCVQANPFRLSEFFTMINKARCTERYFEYDISSLEGKLVDLINFFPFLGKTALLYDEESGWYVFKTQNNAVFQNGVIYTYGIVNRLKVTRKKSRFFYLADVNKQLLRYENLRGSQKCFLTNVIDQNAPEVVEKPYELPWDVESVHSYLAPRLLDPGDPKNIGNYHLYNVNYKYIKHLALAISDALGRDDYKESYRRLLNIFPDTARQLQDKNDIDLAVLMMLIENSPSIVLHAVIKTDPRIAYRIVHNLKNRLGAILEDKFEYVRSKNDFEEYIDNLIEFDQMRIGNRSIETDVGKKLKEELKVEAKANFILSVLSAIDGKYPFKSSNYLGQSLESLEKESTTKNVHGEDLWQTITVTLGTVLKRLICFYSGIFAYGKNKIKYDAISEYRLPSKDMIRQYQSECRKEFEETARSKWEEIGGTTDLLDILRLFIGICEKCKDYDDSYQGRSDESRCLYAVLGKYHIIDMDVFGQEIPRLDSLEPLTAGSSDNTVRWWLREAIRLIRFFATGTFEDLAEGEISKYFLHSINPMIATVYRSNSGRDGYDATTFFLTMDVKGNDIADYQYEINVLSEFSYDMNLKYYCLPNILRSNEKWWIDPFLIDCDAIDDIFRKE